MRVIIVLLAICALPFSALADDVASVKNEDLLKSECPHSQFDESNRACQVRALLGELRSTRTTLKEHLEREERSQARDQNLRCQLVATQIELYRSRIELAALRTDAEQAVREAEYLSVAQRQAASLGC